MSDAINLKDYEDRLKTHMGAWFPGERVVMRGKDLHYDLIGHEQMDWMELYLYSITGRRFTKEQLKILNAIWTTTSFPEPRLWNNRVAALAGSARSTGTLAIGAAIAVSEARIYGHLPNIRSSDFFHRAGKALGSGITLEDFISNEMKKHRGIFGYGRPVARMDERIPHLVKIAKDNGMGNGRFFKMAFDVERILLKSRWRLHMNITGLDAALTTDMGFSPREHYFFIMPCFLAGMPPCFLDTLENPEGSFFPLRCSRVEYKGKERRQWE